MAIINDDEMFEEMVADLVNNYGWEKEDAIVWVNDKGHEVVSSMWDEYSHFLQESTERRKEK